MCEKIMTMMMLMGMSLMIRMTMMMMTMMMTMVFLRMVHDGGCGLCAAAAGESYLNLNLFFLLEFFVFIILLQYTSIPTWQ